MTDNAANGVNRSGLRIVVAILRWVWIVLFAVLVIASIVVHAPWKVLALCSIFLLGALAIPRRPRRYFWISVGAIVLAAGVWIFLPNDSQGWRPYAFDVEMEAFLAKHRVPDAENAARIYEDICRAWGDGDPNEPNAPDDWYDRVRNGPWRGEEYPAVAAWLDYHEPTMRRLVEAAGLERCFFEESIRDWLVPLNAEIPPTADMRQLAFLLAAAANRDWGERGLDVSVQKQLVVLKLGEHLSSQPEVMFALVGAAVESLAMEQFNRAMVQGDVDLDYLDRVDRAVAAIQSNWRSTFEATLELERLRTKNLLAAGFYQVSEAGRVRYSRDPFGLSRNPRYAARPGYWEERANRARVIMQWFAFPSDPSRVSERIDKAYEKHVSLPDLESGTSDPLGSSAFLFVNADWSRFQWNFEYFMDFMVSMGRESHVGLCRVFRGAETIRRGTLGVVALRRYKDDRGSWPSDLKAAEAYGKDLSWTDAWGRPFVYMPAGEGFVLYSTGENGSDEKGERRTEYDEESFTSTVLADDVMIWPDRRERE